jgi:hypothetical protein
MKKNLIIGAIALLAASSAFAQTASYGRPFKGVFGAGLAMGGQEYTSGTSSDGTVTKSRAGDGIVLFAGAEYRVNQDIALQLTYGYSTDRTNTDSLSTKIIRRPVELLVYGYKSEKFRFGAGPRVVKNPTLTTRQPSGTSVVNYDNSIGGVIEVEYFLNKRLGLKGRLINDTYKAKGQGDRNGSHIEILGSIYL